ncbi:MAG: tRNA (adenosine(37)-N6)-threonylcarbamoyltransferase complex dimerization subunit type 1 TsaB [SAR324 cluster bacterium]
MTHALAIDTTSDYLSLGVLRAGRVAANHYALCGTRIARTILPQIEALLAGAGLEPACLDVLIVNRGPGSFTGTRIGMSVALTLGRVLGKPVVGVNALNVLAAQADPAYPDPFHAILNCIRDEAYAARFQWQRGRIQPLSEIRLTTLAEASAQAGRTPCLVRRFTPDHPGLETVLDALTPVPLRYAQPDALRVMEVGLPLYLDNTDGPFETPTPLYLKSEAFRSWRPAGGAAS